MNCWPPVLVTLTSAWKAPPQLPVMVYVAEHDLPGLLDGEVDGDRDGDGETDREGDGDADGDREGDADAEGELLGGVTVESPYWIPLPLVPT